MQPTVGIARADKYGSKRFDEQGTIGYYRVHLQRYAIDAEVTTANRLRNLPLHLPGVDPGKSTV